MWKGRTIDSLTFGELRAACRELDVFVSTDRSVMEKRVLNALQRDECAKEETLDIVMNKKARTGFSAAEFDRFAQLMKENLIEGDEHSAAVGADHTSEDVLFCTNLFIFQEININLDRLMIKKARIGFSIAEYHRYAKFMRANIVDDNPVCRRSFHCST